MTRDNLDARIEAVNAAHTYANRLAPILLDYFVPFVGSKILKADGTLLKKLVLPEFPGFGPAPNCTLTTYRLRSDYSLAWVAKVCRNNITPGHSSGCLYYETTLYVGDLSGDILTKIQPWTPRAVGFNKEAILEAITGYQTAQLAADVAKDAIPYQFQDFA